MEEEEFITPWPLQNSRVVLILDFVYFKAYNKWLTVEDRSYYYVSDNYINYYCVLGYHNPEVIFTSMHLGSCMGKLALPNSRPHM